MPCDKIYGPQSSNYASLILTDPNNRFVTDADIALWNTGAQGQGLYKSMVFRRSASVPGAVSGGSWTSPVPDGGLWTESPLPGSDPLYVCTRLFSSDGQPPQETDWTGPFLFSQNNTGSTGGAGSNGTNGVNGTNGLNGATGAAGSTGAAGANGTSLVYLGAFTSHPVNPSVGEWYRNTSTDPNICYVWYGTTWEILSIDGTSPNSIDWQGEFTGTTPTNPVDNMVIKYRANTSLPYKIYIYTGGSWVLMIEDGVDGNDGLTVSIVYSDNAVNSPPSTPTGIAGTSSGNWTATAGYNSNWMSQKIDNGTTANWSAPIRITGYRGSSTYTFDHTLASTICDSSDAANWAGTPLLDQTAKDVAYDIINLLSDDGFIRPNDKITLTDNANSIAGTRIYIGQATNSTAGVAASDFSTKVVETIDGSLLVNGTVSANSMATDFLVAGKIVSSFIEVDYLNIKDTAVIPPTAFRQGGPYTPMSDGAWIAWQTSPVVNLGNNNFNEMLLLMEPKISSGNSGSGTLFDIEFYLKASLFSSMTSASTYYTVTYRWPYYTSNGNATKMSLYAAYIGTVLQNKFIGKYIEVHWRAMRTHGSGTWTLDEMRFALMPKQTFGSQL